MEQMLCRKGALYREFGKDFEVVVPVAQGATTAAPQTKEEIEKVLTVAPRYGIKPGGSV
jgi:hypothetical protein